MRGARTFLVMAAICITASAAVSETRVRSGEHARFTRLVLYLPSPVDDWTVSRVDSGYRVAIEPAPTSLDTSDVFDFIPRTRVRSIALRDGAVQIDSGCDCHVSVFAARPNVIAIDVRDGPDPTVPPTPVPPPELQDKPDDREIAIRLAVGETPDWTVSPLVAFKPIEPSALLLELDTLSQAVARAASGGLLAAREDGLGLAGPGIETRSAFERNDDDGARGAQPAHCTALSMLESLPSIDGDTAWQRIEASGEDVPIPSVRALAYLALGFGAEAAETFSKGALPADIRTGLIQAAHFIDAPDRGADQSLRAGVACGGVAGLLGVIAGAGGDTDSLSERRGRAAVATLSRLPPALRSHLAPHLEARLQAVGFPELAQSARFTRQRTGSDVADGVRPRDGSASTPSAMAVGLPNLPETPFFEPGVSAAIYDTIAAARFAQEDRVLIEAWIQEAPSTAEADAATRFYVAALNRAGRPLDALAHLDARIGRRGVMRPDISAAVAETLEVAARELGAGALLVLGARLPERPWFGRLPQPVREMFGTRVETVRMRVLGPEGGPEPGAPLAGEPERTPGTDRAVANLGEPGPRATAPETTLPSARRLAADAAITAAGETIARSARLRAQAAERSQEWASGPGR